MVTALCPFTEICIIYQKYSSETKDNSVDILKWKPDEHYKNLGYYSCKALTFFNNNKKSKKDLSDRISSNKINCSYLDTTNL